MDLISIIVPVYKVESYLERCIQSIVDQTYTNLEIILVDDGSPDRCPQICDDWAEKDARIRVIHKENGGLSDARNAGMSIAAGEYIAFVDSDDWVSKYYIERLYDAIRKTGVKISACDVRLVCQDSEAPCIISDRENFVVYSAEQAFSAPGWQRVRAVAWNKLYHRLLLEGEAYPVGRHHEDEFVTYRIIDKAQQIAYIPEAHYCYFQRDGSIMRGFSMKRLDALDAYMQRLQLFKEKYPELYVREKAGCCISIAGFYQGALEAEMADMDALKKKLRACRKEIRFSLSELKRYSVRELMYIIGTRVHLSLFCETLYNRRGKQR